VDAFASGSSDPAARAKIHSGREIGLFWTQKAIGLWYPHRNFWTRLGEKSVLLPDRSFATLLTWGFLAASLAASLTGCGGGDDSAAATAASETPDAGAAAGAPPAEAMSMPAPGGDPSGAAGGMGPAGMGRPGMGPPGMMPPGGAEMTGAESSGETPEGMMPGGMPGMPDGGMMPGMTAPGMGMPGMGMSGAAAVVSNRPADVATWSDNDLQTAVRERDPKVLEAIDARVKSAPGDPEVAELLTKLLLVSSEPPTTAAFGGAGAAAGTFPGDASGARSSGLMKPGALAPGMGTMPPAGGAATPGLLSPATPGSATPGGAPAGLSPQGFTPPGSSESSDSSAPAAPTAAPPQSSFHPRPHRNNAAIDSLTAMLTESVVAWQQPGVGAMRQRMTPGGIAGQSPAAGATPGAMPPSGVAGFGPGSGDSGEAAASAAAAGSMEPGMDAEGSFGGQPGFGAPAAGGLSDQQLVDRIVEGLIRNNSPVAWQTIHAIASGKVETPLGVEFSAETVTIALLRNAGPQQPQIEQILTAILAGQAQLPPESQTACVRAMSSVSAAAVSHLTGLGSRASGGNPASGAGGFAQTGMGMPGMMRPGMSIPGQAGMGPGMMPPGMMSPGGETMPGGIESAGAGFGTEEVPGSSVAAGSTMSGSVAFPEDKLASAAAVLWGPKAVESVIQKLAAASDMAAVAEALEFAVTIPQKKVRDASFAALNRLHSLGAEPLRSAGVFQTPLDPGMLVVLKSLPRSKPTRAEGGAAAPLDSWAAMNQEYVVALRNELRSLSMQPGKLQAVTDELPLRLHRNAVPEFSGVLVLPATGDSSFQATPPAETKVYYARTSFVPQRARDQEEVAGHYESRAGGYRRADQAKGLLWIDGVKSTTTGLKRSMDVLIQAAGSGAGGGFSAGGESGIEGGAGPGFGGPPGGGGSGGFTIEVVVVEIADPKGTAAEPVVSDNK
jgi:hypothetical protein